MKKVLLLSIMLLSVLTIFSACSKHEHVIVMREAQAATCSQYGNDTYYECVKCHEIFLDEDCTRQIQYQDVVKAKLAHTPKQDWKGDENGHYHHCEVCGEKLVESIEDHNFEGGNICVVCGFVKPSDGLEYRFVQYDGSGIEGCFVVTGIGRCTDKKIVVPSYYDTLPVTEIDEFAFVESDIEGIKFLNGLNKIGDGAFSNCKYLQEVDIPDSVTSIGVGVFTDCEILENVRLSDNLTSLNSSLFDCCEKLKSINIPSKLTTIEMNVFYHCSELQNIKLPDSLISIGEGAFHGCSSLKSIEIPSGVTSLQEYVFTDCNDLQSVTFKDDSKLQSIGRFVFEGCESLKSIEIPSGVTSLQEYAFTDCGDLQSVTFKDDSKLQSVGESVFEGCESLKSIEIPSGITSIEKHTFYRCGGLQSVTFKDDSTLRSISDRAFEDCNNLTSIVIPRNVTSIGNRAFEDCNNLTSIVIPRSLTSIGWQTFFNCDNLQNVYYCGTADEWDAIELNQGNASLEEATRFYYSDSDPQESEEYDPNDNYWHYGDNGEIVVWNK